VDPGEDCDSGGVNSDTCNANCTAAQCGDGIFNPTAGEECDDGWSVDGDRDNCLNSCKLARCGDGVVDLQAPFVEACDDGNTSACGTCNATCTVKHSVAAATGTIVATSGSDVHDETTLSVCDGPQTHNRVKFTFTRDSTKSLPYIYVSRSDKPEDVARKIRDAIYDKYMSFDLQLDGAVIRLKNNYHPGGLGNQRITETVSNDGFVVMGMENGTGRDCPKGTGCKSGNDCASGLCSDGNCQ
jgi:cysteine-rich repeat protein